MHNDQSGKKSEYNPFSSLFCQYSQSDGTIDFYSRIKHHISNSSIVLDLGAGRAGWYDDCDNKYKVAVRTLKGYAGKLIAADVDPVVFQNRACDEAILISDTIPLPSESVDVIVADYVLEHIENPQQFVSEITRLLKPDGLFCARTPHRYCYVAMAARLISNLKHAKVLTKVQPERKAIDVFPTFYRMNTLRAVRTYFYHYENTTFLYRADPGYFCGKAWVYHLEAFLHRLMPAFFSSNLFVFCRKAALLSPDK